MLVAAAMAASATMPAYAATDAECHEMWTKADVNKDGVLSGAETARYHAAMRVHDEKATVEGYLDEATFTKACKADIYATRDADAGAPLKGANSFTEGQAKDRALSHGLTDVSPLTKDDEGIWRGTASQEGKSVEVAVDFKGNVVARATL